MMKRLLKLISALTLAVGLGVGAVYAEDHPDAVTKFDKPPQPTKTPPPDVPSNLKGETGMVAVVVIIDDKGSVVDVSVSKSSNPDFEKPSIEAIKKWKFKPAEVGGQAVKAKVTIPVRFSGN